MNDLQKPSLENPPPYNQSACSPLVLAETTTTRTEVVTTTTTETTTHFFSLPQFRKRAPSQQPPKDGYSNHKLPAIPPPSDIALSDKSLPPTPHGTEGSQNNPLIMHSTQDLITSSPVVERAKDVVHFATSQTRPRTAPTHAALGKGLPRSSPAPRLETNTIPFVSSTLPVLTPTIRKSRSFQWLKQNVSENHPNGDHSNHSVNEGHRGSSFDTNSFPALASPVIV